MKGLLKGYKIFQKFVVATVLMAFVLIAFGSFYNLSQINIGGANNKAVMFTFSSYITVVLFLFIVLIFRLIEYSSKKGRVQYIIAGAMFVVMAMIFFVLLQKFDVKPITDSFDDLDEAMYLLDHSKVTMDNVHIKFMGIYGNNYFLVIVFRYLFKLLFFIGVADVLPVLYVINVTAIMIGVFFTWLIVKDRFGMAAANRALFLCTINPLYYGLTFWVYSATISVSIMMALIYVALQIHKTASIRKELMLAAVEGFLLVLGYEIRPTAIFPWIAIVIAAILFTIKHGIYKKATRIAFLMLLISSILYLGIAQVKKSYLGEISHLNYPISYWLLMGSHGNGNFSVADTKLMSSCETKQEKQQQALIKIKENYKKSGITGTVNLWYRKTLATWSDGYSSPDERTKTGETESFLYELIMGNRNHLNQIYSQAFRLIISLGIVFSCFYLWKQKEFPELLFILVLTLFGGLAFYALWEAKNVYSAPFLLVMFILSQYGYSQFISSIKDDIVVKNGRIFLVNYLVLTLFLCFSLHTVFSYATTFRYYRIRSLSNTRINSIIESGNPETIRQDFYVDKRFNEIKLKANVEKDREEISDYEILITDSKGSVLAQNTVNQSDVIDGGITFHFDTISEDNHYYIIIKKQDLALGSLYFYTKYNYYFDSYKGNLLVDGKDGFVNDLQMDVMYTAKESYFGKKERSAVIGLFLIVSLGTLAGLFWERQRRTIQNGQI